MLSPHTQKIWEILQSRPELRGFVLVGGSALALQIQHRESEDLDFAWTQPRLPRQQLRMLRLNLPAIRFSASDDPLAVREAEDCGLDLADFSQSYLLDDQVKVTFFAAEAPERQILSRHGDQPLQLATLDEIFALKALVVAKRSKTRDWFDLYILIRERGYTFEQLREVFIKSGNVGAYDIAVNRLCFGQPTSTDEGFFTLFPDPPTLPQINEFFRVQRNVYEQKEAQRAAENQQTKVQEEDN